MFIWPRQGERSAVAALLEDLGIPFEDGNLLIPSRKNKRFVHSIRFDYNENLDRIRAILQRLVDMLATGRAEVVDS